MAVAVACTGESPTTGPNTARPEAVRSAIDGAPLDAATLERLRRDAQGCLFVARTPDGVVRAVPVPRRLLPFWIPSAARNGDAALAGRPAAVSVALVLASGDGVPRVGASCVLPATFAPEMLRFSFQVPPTEQSARRWEALWRRLAVAPAVPAAGTFALSPEAREVKFELLGVAVGAAAAAPRSPSGLRIVASLADQGPCNPRCDTVVVTDQAPTQYGNFSWSDFYGSDVGDVYLWTMEPLQLEGGGGFGDGSGTGGEPPPTYNYWDVGAPSGITQDWWDKMNDREKMKCLDDLVQCAIVGLLVKESSEWARKETPELEGDESNNKRDALRHAIWQASMTATIGAWHAKDWGDRHEEYSPDPRETTMDQWNNERGRLIGTYWTNEAQQQGIALTSLILQAANDGTLILSLGDSRVPPPTLTGP